MKRITKTEIFLASFFVMVLSYIIGCVNRFYLRLLYRGTLIKADADPIEEFLNKLYSIFPGSITLFMGMGIMITVLIILYSYHHNKNLRDK